MIMLLSKDYREWKAEKFLFIYLFIENRDGFGSI